MPESFIDRLGAELVRAASVPPAERMVRRRRWRPLLLTPALAVVGAATAVASGILAPGRPLAPKHPPKPTVQQGAPIPSSASLLPLSAPDPAGGPPWGVRVVRTTRGDACLQVGRLAFGTIGALVDHRFRPFSLDYLGDPMACSPVDARGHGFIGLVYWGLPRSALPARAPRERDRNVYVGLLGPEAVSITYAAADGRPVTVPTAGPDGAYLIVTPARGAEQLGTEGEYTGLVGPGPIRAVTYRDGRTCRPTVLYPCKLVGFVPPTHRRLEQPAVAAPIALRVIRSSAYCTRGHAIRACPGPTPPGFRRQPPDPPSVLVDVSYIARVAVRTQASFYYMPLFFPHSPSCQEIATSETTSWNIRAGQRVTFEELVMAGCHGIVRGAVRFHPDSGPNSAAPEPDPVDRTSLTVGSFSFRIP